MQSRIRTLRVCRSNSHIHIAQNAKLGRQLQALGNCPYVVVGAAAAVARSLPVHEGGGCEARSIVYLKGNNESWEEDKLDDARKNVGSLEQLSKHFVRRSSTRIRNCDRQRSEGNDEEEQERLWI
jgi:hypothetical protein